MGYLPQFKNDIFISYRHASNASNNWVDEFHKQLRASLEERVGQVAIWRDSAEIRAGDQWRTEIDEAVDTAAIFLAVFVKTYFDSSVCAKELDRFLARTKDPKQVIQRMIVPIFKLLPRPDQVPPELDAIHHHLFFQSEPYSEFVPGDDKTTHRFYEALSRLALDLSIQLGKLRGDTLTHMVGTIYLAQVGPELYTEREKLRSDLLQRGYWVVPEHPYLWHASDFDKKIAEDLDAAQLCVHLVGRTASSEPETPKQARLQLELATKMMKRKSKPPPLVWISPAKETADAARNLIEYVEQDLANEGIEYGEGSLEDFKTQIYDHLPPQPAAPSVTKVCEIALIVEEGNIGATGDLNDVLVDKLKREPQRLQFSGAVPKEPSSFIKALGRCEQCIIFWGAQSEGWLHDILALQALAGHLGKDRLAVYVAAPVTPEKTTFRTNKARMIQATSAMNETELREFLAVRMAGQ
jgi:TIR domain